jgi:hypothetical protein
MLPHDQIADAVDIHHRSYKLLLWVGWAIDAGVITLTRSHSNADAIANAFEWVQEHYDFLPEELRPSRDRVRAFSNYFGSYVTTSFDLTDALSCRLGCCCEVCRYLANATHMRPKKLGKRDRDGARQERIARVILLAQEEGVQLIGDLAADIATGPLCREAAYSAYGQSLLERIGGSECGPYVLALWREIAWKPEGSPIKHFELSADDFIETERRLIAEMKRRLRASGLS